jgi:hypothetical protein
MQQWIVLLRAAVLFLPETSSFFKEKACSSIEWLLQAAL